MNAIAIDALAWIEKLDEPKSDSAGTCLILGAGEVQIMVVLDLGPGDDLVNGFCVASVLEVHGDYRAERWRVRHLDEEAASRDIASYRYRISVQLAADDHDERFIETVMNPLVERVHGHRRRRPVCFQDMGQIESAALHLENDRRVAK